jgi:hypothetical protein
MVTHIDTHSVCAGVYVNVSQLFTHNAFPAPFQWPCSQLLPAAAKMRWLTPIV